MPTYLGPKVFNMDLLWAMGIPREILSCIMFMRAGMCIAAWQVNLRVPFAMTCMYLIYTTAHVICVLVEAQPPRKVSRMNTTSLSLLAARQQPKGSM